ncbi:N-acetylmuramoyl-L-alanine amidase [Priestia filamentosa]|uniref:N-acetylmuramoyl-L-alanine amidase n=1 Tax=Priestia filamentosa TaxID=1402861 RepID=UPI003981ADE6
MSTILMNKYVNNNVVTEKEIREFEKNRHRLKKRTLATATSLYLLGSGYAVHSHIKNHPFEVESHISKANQKVSVSITKMGRLLDASVVTKARNTTTIDGINIITYFTDKGAIANAPNKGAVIRNYNKTVILKHSSGNHTYYSVLEGIQSSLKAGDIVNKGDNLGTVSGGILSFSVATEMKGDKPVSFVDKATLGQINQSFGYKTDTDPSKEEGVSIIPNLHHNPSEGDKKVVSDLPYGDIILSVSEKYDVDPVLVASIIKQESGFKEKITSKSGAVGLMQLMPETAQWLGVKDSYNPSENIEGGVKFFKTLTDKYDDSVKALYAYNGGPGNVDKWTEAGLTPEEFPWKETKQYAPNILHHYEVYKDKAAKLDPKSAYQEKIDSISNQYKNAVDFGNFHNQLQGLTIGVDAGHYSKAPGTVSYDRKTTELEVNRQIKQLVITKLKEAGATVIDSEGDIKSLKPGQRAKVFDEANVDFAISLHNNASTNQTSSGTETLYESNNNQSKLLAQSLQKNIAQAIPTIDNRGVVSRDNLGVFTEGKSVTALAETGFMSNPYDMELLRTPSVLESIANAIVKGCIDYTEINHHSQQKEGSFKKAVSYSSGDINSDEHNFIFPKFFKA